MKRLMLFLFIAAFCIPQNGEAQYVSWDNLTLWAGGAYSSIYGTGGLSHTSVYSYSKFNVRPHARISYTLPLTDSFQAAIFSGYSQWCGKNHSSNQRRTITLHTFAIGTKIFYKNSVVSIGPVFSWNKILSAHYKYEYKSNTEESWSTSVDNDGIEMILGDQMYNLGFVLQREIRGGIKVSLEGLYGLNDILIYDRGPEEARIGNIKWYPRQYRFSIGYSF